MAYQLDGQILEPGEPFTVGDYNYSGAELRLWSRPELEALGLEWVDVAATLEARLADLADRRWQATLYFVYDGVLTQADGAMGVVNATLALRARRGIPPETQQSWKLADGDFRQWDEADIEAFGYAIADHIQSCFDRESVLTDALAAAADLSAVDLATGWPA